MKPDVQEKVWNIELVVEDIKKFPQTYNTILGDEYKNNTFQTIIRRKLNKLCKSGEIFKTNIPGTRFGKIIFYHEPKDYNLLFEAGRLGSSVYCFFEYEKKGKFYIQLEEYWILKGGNWIPGQDKVIFGGNVLKWL